MMIAIAPAMVAVKHQYLFNNGVVYPYFNLPAALSPRVLSTLMTWGVPV
jgi:hypothetical protein